MSQKKLKPERRQPLSVKKAKEDLHYLGQGGWRPAVINLIRYLRSACARRFEEADSLEETMRTIPPRPSHDEEKQALSRIRNVLAALKNRPAPDLSEQERSHLRDLLREAIHLTGVRSRALPEKLDSMKCAIAALKRRMENLGIDEQSTEGNRQGLRPTMEEVPKVSIGEYVFAPSGNGYFIKGLGESGHFQQLDGFEYIAQLVRSPGKPVSMLDLIGADSQISNDRGSPQLAIDVDGKKKVQERLRELDEELEEANNDNNPIEADRIRVEKKQYHEYLLKAIGVLGKGRDMNNRFDKLRSKINNSIRRACKKLRTANPPLKLLAEHFDVSISAQSRAFIYQPTPSPPWRFDVFV